MRQSLQRCAALGVALVLGLSLTEGLLRLLQLAPTNSVVTVTETEFRSLPGLLSPHQNLIDRRDPRLPYRLTTNSLGYRGPEFPLPRERDEVRILFTGDSFAFGDFVGDDQTLPAQLERHLAGRCGHVRVVNAGLDAASIVDEAHMIERGLALSPDLVILLFSENDVADLNGPSIWDQLAANRRAKSRFLLALAYPLLRRTALWNLALNLRARFRAQEHAVRLDWRADGADSVTQRLRETYRRSLLAVRDTLVARGIPLVLLAYPSHFNVASEARRGQLVWLTQTAVEAGITAVDLLQPLVASGLPTDSLYLLPYDGHPSPRGYEITAAYLAQRLASAGRLATRCGTVAAAP